MTNRETILEQLHFLLGRREVLDDKVKDCNLRIENNRKEGQRLLIHLNKVEFDLEKVLQELKVELTNGKEEKNGDCDKVREGL